MNRPPLSLVAALLLGLAAPAAAPAAAQELDDEAADRAIRAAVKVVMLSEGGGGSTGSGSMIDPRGYVLTNFHVVGHMRPESGPPGTLYNAQNRVHLATVESARQSARPRWIGVVVRGDVRLDLALIRIISDTDGNPVRGAPFPTVAMANTRQLRPGSRVWAFGYPLGVRTINVTEGSVAGFQMNARDDVSWIRTDTEFNPGNSGGMLIDGRGRLVAVPTRVYHGRGSGRALEPVELARPVERMPREWLEAMRAGPIENVRITGVPSVRAGRPVRDLALGDAGSMSSPDQHFYRIEEGPRPATIRTVRPLPIALMHREGVIREGMGEVALQEDDPPSPYVSVLIPNAAEGGVDYVLSVEPTQPQGAAPGDESPGTVDFGAEPPTTPPTARPPTETPPGAEPPTPPDANLPNPFDTSPPDSGGEGAGATRTIEGGIVDAHSGRPVAGAWLVIGQPGLNLRQHIGAFLQGRISEQQFNARLVALSRTDVRGRYVVRGVAPGRYPGAAMAPGYRPSMLNVTVGNEGPTIHMNAIRLSR